MILRCFNFFALIVLVAALTGCANSRTVTISADPPSAHIKVNGIDRGPGRVTQTFTFPTPSKLHYITASKAGYMDETAIISLDKAPPTLHLKLKKRSRRVEFTVIPAPAILSDNGKPLTAEPVSTFTAELEFSVDVRGNWTSHTIMAERQNYLPGHVEVTWTEQRDHYTIELQPMRKDLRITTTPTGANVYLDDQFLGVSPVVETARAFSVDVNTNDFVPVKLKVTKPGYDPVEREIGWDGGKGDYEVDLIPKAKNIRIATTPPGSIVTLDGVELPRDKNGDSIKSLQFTPTNDKGDLHVFRGTASKPGSEAEWQPVPVAIGWDDGKTDYAIALKEVLTRSVPLLTASWVRGENGAWDVEPRTIQTLAMKNPGESSASQKPLQLARAQKGSSIDTIAVSPDGRQLLYTLLTGTDRASLRSQMNVISADGGGGVSALSDGKSLDLYPAFTPGGESIIFSSNRAGRRMSVWQAASSGAPGITQVTSGDANELWADVDSDPRPRVYYQALIDSRADARLFSAQLGTTLRTDMQISGTQPRVSPRNDTIVFCGANERTGKRDLYRVATTGGQPQNLTNTPDIDEFDPAWSHDGNRIAFASDELGDPQEKRRNFDIWTLDVNRAGASRTRITNNGSHDDCPQWDPGGRFIYFRSNRGGEWGVWKFPLK